MIGVPGKVRRLLSVFREKPQRQGACDGCGLCCGDCPALTREGGCAIYAVRPLTCRIFPAGPEDLAEVARCGYSFERPPIVTRTSSQ